jgi:DNA polymerase III subunit alpha
MSEFIHLHNHSHYSLLDGACTIDQLVNTAAKYEMPSLALTDHGSMFGTVEFYKKAKDAGIKPIIGNEMYMVTKGSRFDKGGHNHPEGKRHGYNHLVLLAKNETGYKNLIKLTTLAHTEGFYYKPRIDFELLRKHSEGLVALTACAGGVIASYLVARDYDAAKDIASQFKDIFADDVYLEIQDHGIDREEIVREGMVKLSAEMDMKLIATNDIHYIKNEHAVAHNVFIHISDTRGIEDIRELSYGTDQVYFKSPEEMVELFKDYPQAIESTLEVAEKCNFDLELGTTFMPEFPVPDSFGNNDLDAYLKHISIEGLNDRYDEITPEISDRLDFELNVIAQMGYSGYFLIVQDFINAAKEKSIRVGPGRGSAAGSLVAYSLGITNVDPIRYNLLFERFLNPERVSMPDIDIDFQDDRREEVIEYTRQKYGNDSVSQIATFGKLSARAVLKDVGRVLGVSLGIVESITKHIEAKMGKVPPLKYVLGLEKDPKGNWSPKSEIAWVKDSDDPKIQDMVKYSLVLEGLIRNIGMHAAGVVIAPSDTSDYVPLYKSPNSELMTMFNMSDLEDAGLLKMDFLGLITLSVIDRTVKMVRETKGEEIDIDKIPLDDPATYKMFGEAHTIGVFQFESAPMRDYLRKLKPQSIDDLAAMNALYRPGPMEFIDEFIDRKYGRKDIAYLHPKMEPILNSTYGIIVFQEQVMQLASEIAGFTLAQADIMRRAMGKKKAEVMAQQRDQFVAGAGERGISAKVATEIFDMIDKFANYGFNKSHSVAYSLLAYQTAYLKANHTPEFMAAMLTSQMQHTTDVTTLIDECKKLNIEVLPPDINESLADFSVNNGSIRFGMAAIKNVGHGAVDAFVEARKTHGRFETIFDVCEGVGGKQANKKTLESCVYAGAMDSIEGTRAQLFAGIENAIQYGNQQQLHKEAGQSSLFGEDTGSGAQLEQPALPMLEEWPQSMILANEKSVLGFYISGHPLEGMKLDAEALSTINLGETSPAVDGQVVRVCGVISTLKTKIDKRGNTMAFATIEDFTGKAEALIFADPYEKGKNAIQLDAPVLMTGKAEASGDSIKIIANDIYGIEQAFQALIKSICITFSSDTATKKQIKDTIDILDQYRGTGSCPCFFKVWNGSETSWDLVARTVNIKPTKELLLGLREIFGEQNVRISTEPIV